MWRGTLPIAASTASSFTPCSRTRSTIRARVRVEVMPMPSKLPPAALIGAARRSDREPLAHPRKLRMVGEVDLQRRHRDVALLDRVEIGPLARVGGRSRRAHPVARLAARRLHLDDRLGLVPLAEPRDAITLDLVLRQVWNVDVEQEGAQGLLAVTAQQLGDGLRGRLEMPPDLAGERHRDRRNAEQMAFGRGG